MTARTTDKTRASRLGIHLWPVVALALLLASAAPPVHAQTAVVPAGAWGILEKVTYPDSSQIQYAPLTPTNISPPDGATGVALTPTLVASAFADANTTDTHAASQWQVLPGGNVLAGGTGPVFDSGTTTTALTTCVIPPNRLHLSAPYLWHVRYEDNHGNWSEWSAQTSFVTMLAVPKAVKASDGAFPDRVRVTWTGSYVVPSDYAVLRSTHPTTTTATALTGWMDAVAGTSFDDLTADPGVIYYYWVVAASDAQGSNMTAFSACDSGWAGTVVAFPSNRRGSIWIVH